MIRSIPIFAAAALALPALANDCALDYRFHADWAGGPRFAARVTFDAGTRTETRIRISPEWGGVTDFHAGVRELRADSAEASIEQDDAPNRWRVKHPAGGRVAIRYDVVNAMPQADAERGMNHRDFYRNTLAATRFQVFGHGALVWPESLRDSEPVATCVTFSGLPSGWSFASNEIAGHKDGTAAWRGAASPQQLRSSVFLGGDYRLHRRDVEGRPLWIAMRGQWAFEDARFVDATAKVVESHRKFWNDPEFPHFLVSLSPNGVPSGSTGGTGLHNAFAMHASQDFTVPGRAFESILAHEHLHTWLPRRLGTMGEGEAERYWFSEGFTNYLTHRLLLLSGEWRLEEYANALNEQLREHAISPHRDIPNARIMADFWKDPSVQRVPYRRGELFALHLFNLLFGQGTNLDVVLRSLRLDAASVPKEGDRVEADLAVNRLRAAVRKAVGPRADADYQAYIVEGKPLPIDQNFLGPCFVGKPEEKPVYDLGFDTASMRAGKLVGVTSGGPAEKAGLRDGLELAGWGIFQGNTDRDVVIQVREGGKVRNVEYRPVSAKTVQVFQFVPRAGGREGAACFAWLRGRR